jgi:hypothetical protein
MVRGDRVRADSSISTHPIVARLPSRTVTGGALPVRTACTNDPTNAEYPFSGHHRERMRRALPLTSRRVKSSVATPMPSPKTSRRSPPDVRLPSVLISE